MAKEKYIAGIHNYCDRWCEKCAFTNRCSVYASEQSLPLELPDDPSSPEFWDQLKHNFQETLQMLHSIMEQLDEKAALLGNDEPEDLDAPPDDEDKDGNDNSKALPNVPENADWPERYSDAVHTFFNNNEQFFSDQEDEFDSHIRMGIPVDVEQLGFLHEALQTIRWFQHLIGAKIHRALSQLDFSHPEPAHLQSDGNGSAKVAMIGIQRSTDAWRFLERFFPAKSTEVQEVLSALQNTRTELEKQFPHWNQFHRPGFDDEPDAVVRLDYNPN
jgi:hypothetical protein